jgi:deoxycytidine triphosphate deaminase
MENQKISEPTKPMVEEKDYWIDPDPNSTGLLLSDRIKLYVEKVNLVRPFDDESLRPASYTLHAGKDYLLNLKDGMKEGNLEEDKVVEIPPNGLIYIRFLEEINLPFYMIARFNLRVKQVYRGLLLGTGPQVDPGFRGHLNCPIHNFTDEPKRIRFRDPLATIDFEKTTTFGQIYFSGKTEEQIRILPFADMRKSSESIAGLNNLPCKIFEIVNDRPLRGYLPGGESVRSSVYELQEQVQQFGKDIESYRTELKDQVIQLRRDLEKELAFYRNISIWGGAGALLAMIALLVSVYFHLEDYLFNSYRDLQDKFHEMSLSVDRLKESSRSLSSVVVPPSSAAAKKPVSVSPPAKKVGVNPTQDKQSPK